MCKADNATNEPSAEEDNKSSDECGNLLDEKKRKQSGSSDFGLIPKPKPANFRKSDSASKFRIKVPQKLISNQPEG